MNDKLIVSPFVVSLFVVNIHVLFVLKECIFKIYKYNKLFE
jgi:hypothetical protein